MPKTLKVSQLQGKDLVVKVDRMPDTCPMCGRGVKPIRLTEMLHVSGDTVQIAFVCPIEACQSLFIGYYFCADLRKPYRLIGTRPHDPVEREFDPLLEQLSPDFADIYNQAIAAEGKGLTQIVGCGLRKALEFLVKDYAICKHPDEKEKIEKTFLGRSIDLYLEGRPKECAKRAAWLGNDETHYHQRWEDKDIEDMKALIEITVTDITSELLAQGFMEEMPE